MRSSKEAITQTMPSAAAKAASDMAGLSRMRPEHQSDDSRLGWPLRGFRFQPKLTLSHPSDLYEQEADRIADQVMRMPDPVLVRPDIDPSPIRALPLQRKCAACEDEEKLQRQTQNPHTATPTSGLDSAAATLRQGGRPLGATARSFFEPRFGVDFSAVRIHTDTNAAASAKSINALAYTVGRDVVFNSGQYAPHRDSGKRLLAHELTHVVQQRGADRMNLERGTESSGLPPIAATMPHLQLQGDRVALLARLQIVQERLALLRGQQSRLSDDFSGSLMQERLRESQERATLDLHARARSESAGPALWGGTFAVQRIRSAASTAQSNNVITVSARMQLSYLALPNTDARQRATIDVPRIVASIRDVWQVSISNGEYAGIEFRLEPTVSFLQHGDVQASDAFLIQVRAPDSGPSSGDPVSGVISLAPVHLQGSRVIVVAHELAHLFGFTDAYLTMFTPGPKGQRIEQWVVARGDAANRADLLGLIDPVVLRRLKRSGSVQAADVARQTGTVRVWEEEATIVLRSLGVAPPVRPRPTPDSEDFDPQVELDHVRREGEGRLAPIRERLRRAENSMEWMNVVEEIMRLEREESDLNARLTTASPSP